MKPANIFLVIIYLLLAMPAQAFDVDINDSEFTVLNVSTNSPVSSVLDASGDPVQLNPFIRSYIIDTEYNITNVSTVIPSGSVLDASGAPVQLNPSIGSFIIDLEYNLTDVSTVVPSGSVLDASGAPVQLNPSIGSFIIDLEYNLTDVSTVVPPGSVLDASGAPVQLNPSIRSYIIDTEYNITNASTFVPPGSVLDASGAPVQLNPSIRSYIIDTEYNITNASTFVPPGSILDASGAPVQLNPSKRSFIIDSEYNMTTSTIVPFEASTSGLITVISTTPTQIFSDNLEVEVGGTFNRWYRTIPNSTIYINSNYLEFSQPDNEGIFNISVNTTKYGINTPQTIAIITNNAYITKNREKRYIDPSIFSFNLKINPRNYSTSWFFGQSLGGGGGIVAYVTVAEARDIQLNVGNKDTIVRMNRDKSDTLTGGVDSSLFEANAGLASASVLSGKMYVSTKSIYGSQVNVDYINSSDQQKLEGALYILSSILPIEPSPLLSLVITEISNNLTEPLSVDYYESGMGVVGGIEANLVEIDIGPGPDESTENNAKATLGSANLGYSLEKGKSFKTRIYPLKNYNESIIQYFLETQKGLYFEVLGNDICELGNYLCKLENRTSIDISTIIGKGNDNSVYGKTKIQNIDEPINLLEFRNREIIYDYGRINNPSLLNNLIDTDLKASSVFNSIQNNENDIKENASTTINERHGRKANIGLPLGITVLGVKLELTPEIRFGSANDYVIKKGIFHNLNTYFHEEYDYDQYVSSQTVDLSVIADSFISSAVNIISDLFSSLIQLIVTAGSISFFNTGSISFDEATIFSSQNSDINAVYSVQNDQSVNLTISSFAPKKISTQAKALFKSAGLSTSYISVLSGSNFVIGNITDLQPHNISFEPAAQLILNYTDDNVLGINESGILIYKWSSESNAWMPLSSIIDTIQNNVSANITSFGTYAIGFDKTAPAIEWNSTNVSYDRISIEAYIGDDGSGVNSSSIRIYLDGFSQSYSYAPFSGILSTNFNTDLGNHTVRIYAEDTSGNSNYTERIIDVLKSSRVMDLRINSTEDVSSFNISWTGENGTYPIEKYDIYMDGDLFDHTTKTNITINISKSTTVMVIPRDGNNTSGIGAAVYYQTNRLVPVFTCDWSETLEPTTYNQVTLDARSSYVINGTFERVIHSYEWIFNNDINNASYGAQINHTFTSPSINEITLKIFDDNNNSETLTKFINIVDSPPKSITNLDFNPTLTSINLTWINPTDPDFSHVLIYIDNNILVNVTTPQNYYNITELNQKTPYSIGTRTVDSNGNTNSSWINFTMSTLDNVMITNLRNTTYAQTYINWTWTDPSDSNFSKVMIYLNGTFQTNVSKGVQFYNATGLIHSKQYNISTRTVDLMDNINSSWVNHSSITAVPDTTSPASITYLTSTNGTTWINWTWTNPSDADFNYTQIYLNETWKANTSNQFYNETGLVPDMIFEIETRTVDLTGNINSTWINNTAKTLPDTTKPSVTNLTTSASTPVINQFVNISVKVNDASLDKVNVTITYPHKYTETFQMNNTNLSITDEFYFNFTNTSEYGRYNVTINASDLAGNINNTENTWFVTTLPPYLNQSINTTANVMKEIDAREEANMTIELVTSVDTDNGSIEIVISNDLPPGINRSFGLTPFGKYFSVNSTITNISWIKLKFYYTEAELHESGLDESSFKIAWYNDSSQPQQWEILNSGTPGWVYGNGRDVNDVNGSAGYVWVNISHLSDFALVGSPSESPGSLPSISSGGGGGGGGGGRSGENASNIELIEKYDLQISKDALTSYRFTHEKNPIMFLNITGNTSYGIITASIEVLKNTSTLVNVSPEGFVYKNINIWVGTSGYATPKNIKHAEVVFKVPIDWMKTNNIDPGSIELMRYNNGWQSLQTINIGGKNDIVFKADTNSFSSFAIVGKKGDGLFDFQSFQNNQSELIIADPTQEIINNLEMKTVKPQNNSSITGYLLIFMSILIIVNVIMLNKVRKLYLIYRNNK